MVRDSLIPQSTMPSPLPRSPAPRTTAKPLRRALVFGLLCSLVGLSVGGYAVHSAIGDGWGILPVAAACAAFLTGAAVWYPLIERRAALRPGAGLLTGALAGALAHYLCWYLMILIANVDHLWFGTTSSLGEPPMNPIQGLAGAAVFSAFSLYIYGWLTIPAGALLGYLMIVGARLSRT